MPNEYYPFAPRTLSFEQAFPQIEDVYIELIESMKLPSGSSGYRTYSKGEFDEYIPCTNPECLDNKGFSIDQFLRKMVTTRDKQFSTTARCVGMEVASRRQSKRCLNKFKLAITVSYKDDQQEVGE